MAITGPIYCELTPETIAARRARLLPGLFERAQRHEVLNDGYRLGFDPSAETLAFIGAVIETERRCCRWLAFELSVPTGDEPITLTLTGPEDAREYLAGLFEL